MPRTKKNLAVDATVPVIPSELLAHFDSGPVRADAVHAACEHTLA